MSRPTPTPPAGRARRQRPRVLVEQVAFLRKTHGVTQRQIEAALGVTPSYLSHVLGGRRTPSRMFETLLFLFVEVPGAFERARGARERSYPSPIESMVLEVRDRVVAWPPRPRAKKRKASGAAARPKGGRPGVRRGPRRSKRRS